MSNAAMDASCSGSSDADPTPSGPSNTLANLPSRGIFPSTIITSSNKGVVRVYVTDRDTSPPENQLIKTNQTNILIRALQLRRQKSDSTSKDLKGATGTESSRKRSAGKVLDDRASTKKSNNSSTSLPGGSSSRLSEKEYYSMTVEKLRALLKERGLSTKGKKDELVARLRSANG